MTPGFLLFAVCSALSVAGALITILAKNPIRGALGLLATIIGIAGLFLRLNAQFLAAMQLLVYAGAVVILFVFVIMLLGPSAGISEKAGSRSRGARALAGGLSALVSAGALTLIGLGNTTDFTKIGPEHGSVEAVGGRIFRDALVPFEIATILLIVAVIGAIAVARTKPRAAQKAEPENPTLRLYHGPLLARDAEGPVEGTLVERAAQMGIPGAAPSPAKETV